MEVNGLWIDGNLSELELLTIFSFHNNGYRFVLWTYDIHSINAPKQAILKDANEIIPKEDVFVYTNKNKFGHGKGSYAGFSDIFRYKLLYERGGIWVDMDVTCLKPLQNKSEYLFRYHHKSGAVGNIMQCPKNAPVMQWCFEQAKVQVNANNTDWMLPMKILNEGIMKFGLEQYIYNISNIDSWPIVAKMLRKKIIIPTDWYVIHWMNEEFRRLKINKNNTVAPSVYSNLLDKHSVFYPEMKFYKKIKEKIKLTRLYYIFIAVISKIL